MTLQRNNNNNNNNNNNRNTKNNNNNNMHDLKINCNYVTNIQYSANILCHFYY